LLTHAFFKALLFLAAGSVIHAVGGEQDMRKMGGLRKYVPITFLTMTSGVLAISGLPPFAGFFSKDEILAEVYRSTYLGHALWFVGLFTAFLTSFYMFRLWYMTFFGAYRGGETHAAHGSSHDAGHHASHTPHESSWVMLTPLILLAVLSLIGGWVGVPAALGGHDEIGHFLEPVVKEQALNFEQANVALMTQTISPAPKPASEPAPHYPTERLLSGLSVFAGLLGLFFADLLYRRKPELPAKIAEKIRAINGLVQNKYWVDEIYGGLIVRPLLFVSKYALWIVFDRGLIDGGGAGIGSINIGLGAVVRRIQSGNIRSYAGWLAFGAAAILLITYFGLGSHLLIH
jgi:NADH-quinone oxidoreductase subunit L